MFWLKQSTAVDVQLGPFLDSTDGNTVEGGLTITQPDIRLAKNGGAFAQKSAAQTLSHGENGYYSCNLSTTDTDTLGRLRVHVHESGALPVWQDFMVVPANVWDSLFGADLLQIDITQYLGAAAPALVSSRFDASVGAIAANAITATSIASDAITAAKIAADAITAAKVADGTIDAATFAAGAINAAAIADGAIDDTAVADDMNAYHMKVWVVKESTTADHYAVGFFKNGQPVTSGITSPTIQVIKASDGSDLIASTSLTQIGSTGLYKKDESTNKMVGGAIYFAKVEATIDSATRSWFQQVGRDST